MFTTKYTDPNGLITLRVQCYQPSLGVFASLDPWEGSCARAMSLNGYSWVEGNVINAVDPSGICWDHPMTTSDQQNQCLTAWTTYASSVDLGDATKRDLLNQEDAYWGDLSYSEFVHLWNDNQSRPPLSTNQSGDILQNGLLGAGAISIANPLPGPEDLLALFGLACLGVAAVFVAATAIALPMRQYYDFPQTEERERDIPIPLPIPWNGRKRCEIHCRFEGAMSCSKFIINLVVSHCNQCNSRNYWCEADPRFNQRLAEGCTPSHHQSICG
jgi:RHS repeat-associated protein